MVLKQTDIDGEFITEIWEKDWKDMPEFNQKDNQSFRHVIVHFKDNNSVIEFFKIINQHDTGKTKTIWFPPQKNMNTVNL